MRWITLIIIGLLLCYCSDDPDPGDGDGDGDTDSDGDGDTDGDSDGDVYTGPPDCPRNSGWPCTCNTDVCDDGSVCVHLDGMPEYIGLCSALCDPDQPPARTCPDTGIPASMGLCFLQSEGGINPTHCLLGCPEPDHPACPSDQRCVDLGISGEIDFCIPTED